VWSIVYECETFRPAMFVLVISGRTTSQLPSVTQADKELRVAQFLKKTTKLCQNMIEENVHVWRYRDDSSGISNANGAVCPGAVAGGFLTRFAALSICAPIRLIPTHYNT
jgi:hypothetical protein